jgi:uncharacterized protein YfbU (UPF0304 family)
MNANDIKANLEKVRKTLESENVDKIKRLELQILENQLEMQMEVGTFDPLKDLDSVTIVDLSQLNALVQEVENEIQNEIERGKLVDKVILLAKSGLKAAGLPIG